jgi:hypothetical protein
MTDRAIPAAPSRVAHFQDQLPDSKIISGQAVHSGFSRLADRRVEPLAPMRRSRLLGSQLSGVGGRWNYRIRPTRPDPASP